MEDILKKLNQMQSKLNRIDEEVSQMRGDISRFFKNLDTRLDDKLDNAEKRIIKGIITKLDERR